MTGLTFPTGFVWGAATSAYQIEGAWNIHGKGPSIWDDFVHQPGNIAGDQTADVAIDHYRRWKDDVGVMAALGLQAYRFSISWPRVLPSGTGRVNEIGLSYYDRLVDHLLADHIQPYVCLFHWDLPQALQDRGGWPNRDTAFAFADYARVVSRRLGDRVTTFFTHNEPWVAAIGGYLTGRLAPGVKDPFGALAALHHMLLSHGLAYEAIRASTMRPAKVGITLNLTPVHPASESVEDHAAAARYHTFCNRLTLDPILRGSTLLEQFCMKTKLPVSPVQPGDLSMICKCDLLGVNYYSRYVALNNPAIPMYEVSQMKPRGSEYSSMWEIYPSGIYEILEQVWREYQPACEIMVTENGVPSDDAPDDKGRIVDSFRIRYLSEHLKEIRRCIAEGIPVRGYFVWSVFDNFEWTDGYGPRFGLVYVDYATQKRVAKESGRWYRDVILRNALE